MQAELNEITERVMLNDAWMLLERCLTRAIQAMEARVAAGDMAALDRLREETIVKHGILLGLKPFSNINVDSIRTGLDSITDFLFNLKEVVKVFGVFL